jgi:hypothetical protein
VHPVRPLLWALALAPALAAALEPRFDHRDTHGVSVEGLFAHDTVARSGSASASSWRPAPRLAWGLAVSGEGDEVLVGATLALRSLDDPERTRVIVAADARYRGYFGTEQVKTFFDVGLWVPVRSPLAVGPLVGVGVAYDFTRAFGAYLAGSFATAFGQARIASLGVSAGAQFRFELP